MGKIIKAIAHDGLCVEGNLRNRSPEHQRVLDKMDECMDELAKSLEETERKLLNELESLQAQESAYYAEERFCHGFRLGSMLMAEAFVGSEEYVFGEECTQEECVQEEECTQGESTREEQL